jgi:antagonist of KipI
MSLRVLEPGLYTLVVDFGRPRWRSLGVPVGGAADRTALALGNALVGNPAHAAALEITLAGPTLEASCLLACVVYGAPFALESDRQDLHAGTTFTLAAGERLHIGGTPEGARGYLCVGGGLAVPAVLGSRSGLAPLAAGAELPCQSRVIGPRFIRFPPPPTWPCGGLPEYLGTWTRLRVLSGPQADWFPTRGLYEPAQEEVPALPPRFTVSPASNRMGLRLQGVPLSVPDRELVSEPVCPGSVQVTRDGQCIILGVDGQTIGGYPKVAQVISADLDLLGQLRPGSRVCFVRVGLEEAESLYRQQQAELRERAAWLRASLANGGAFM